MIGLLRFVVAVLASPFKSKIRFDAENASLRHQLVVLRRQAKGRAHLTNNDRWFLVQMYRWFPLILEVITIVHSVISVPGDAHFPRTKLSSFMMSTLTLEREIACRRVRQAILLLCAVRAYGLVARADSGCHR